MLAEGTPVQVRSFLQQLHLEIILRGRRLDTSVSEPLSQLVKAGNESTWCARWPEIWKWIQFGPYASEMKITREELRLMMGENVRAVKMVERARNRSAGGYRSPGTKYPP